MRHHCCLINHNDPFSFPKAAGIKIQNILHRLLLLVLVPLLVATASESVGAWGSRPFMVMPRPRVLPHSLSAVM